MRSMIVMVSAVAAIAAGQEARGDIVQLRADMDGLQAIPPVATPGTGIVEFELNTDTAVLTLISGSYSGLLGTLQMAHVHGFVPPGEKGAMLFMLQHTAGSSGTLSLMGGSVQLKGGDVEGMLQGLTYVALHTDIFMAGEIRGQILVVPAPGALAMLGLAGLIGSRRRRR